MNKISGQERCFICGADIRLLYDFPRVQKSFSIYKCNGCGHSRTFPEPDISTLKSLYSKRSRRRNENYGREYSSAFLERLKEWLIIRPLLLKLKRFFGYIKTPTLLDVGCATGWITDVSSRMGFNASGLEANPFLADVARKKFKLEIYEGFLEELDTENKFDAVTMFHVLEHMVDPHSALKTINNLLNDKGKLMIVVPNGESLGTKIFRENYNWNVRHHVSYFSKRSLRIILEESGFKVIKLSVIPSTPLLLTSYNRMIRNKYGVNSSFRIGNKVLGNLLMLPLAITGKIIGRAEVLAVYCKKS